VSGTGGVAARRAVLRWALRLYRREWRQQALVLALLTVSVAAAVGLATAAYNTAAVAGNATFGTANHRYTLQDPNLEALDEGIAAAEARFGPVDLIARWSRPIPGSVDTVEIRAHDPNGPYSRPLIALHDGRYPTADSEVALTDGVAELLQAEVGATVRIDQRARTVVGEVALTDGVAELLQAEVGATVRIDQRARTVVGEVALTDGVAELLQAEVGATVRIDQRARTVVGVVENPSDLTEEFALVDPTETGAAESVTILIGGTGAFDEVAALRDFGDEHLPNADITSRQGDEHEASNAAVAVLGTSTIAMVLVSLIAAAGFVAVAQRRQRQLGMLGAIGATQKHLRLVVMTSGAAIGITAAAVGVGLGLTGWAAVAPRLEASVGHRIDSSNIPWWVVAAAAVIAVVTATMAAWWPARAVSRLPITGALSGRPPEPQPARRSASLSLMLLGIGVACLVLADQQNPLLVIIGTIATVAAVLLVSPLALSGLSVVARPFPVAIRVAMRDLARHQARAGMALAAIALALGMQVAAVVTATAAEHASGLGNLADNQLLVWTRADDAPEGVSPFYTQDENDDGFSPFIPAWSSDDLQDLERNVDEIAALLDDPTVTALDVASDPDVPPDPGIGGRVAVTLAQPTDIGYLDVALLYVATDDLLRRYGLDPRESIDADVFTVPPNERVPDTAREIIRSDDLYFADLADPPEPVTRHSGSPGPAHLAARLVHHPRRAASPRLGARTGRLAGGIGQPHHRRDARRRPLDRGRCWRADRGAPTSA